MLSYLIGTMLDLKLELADKAVDMLPEVIRSEVRGIRTEMLTCLNGRLSSWLEKNPPEEKGSKNYNLKKIELDQD